MNGPETPPPSLLPPPPPAHLHARVVPWRHAFAWYEEAMRLWKRAPVPWALLAFATLVCELALQGVPIVGPLLGKIVTPLVGCGMVLAAATADRGRRPALRLAVAAFRAPPRAVAAIVAAAFVTFAAEGWAAWWVADANLFVHDHATEEMSRTAIVGVYAIGVLASLPVGFVPFHVLFERTGVRESFAASWRAFLLNTWPLIAYAAASMLLLGIGLLTMGVALVVVLPLWTASSYAAWKDIFGVRDAPDLD